MLLFHDLGEIEAGDKIIYESETEEQKNEEAKSVLKLLNYLPEDSKVEYMNLWYEFEAGESDDSKFAKAIDRIPPLLHNIYGTGNSWKTYNIKKNQVFTVNRRIKKGSKAIWNVIEDKLNYAIEAGFLD